MRELSNFFLTCFFMVITLSCSNKKEKNDRTSKTISIDDSTEVNLKYGANGVIDSLVYRNGYLNGLCYKTVGEIKEYRTAVQGRFEGPAFGIDKSGDTISRGGFKNNQLYGDWYFYEKGKKVQYAFYNLSGEKNFIYSYLDKKNQGIPMISVIHNEKKSDNYRFFEFNFEFAHPDSTELEVSIDFIEPADRLSIVFDSVKGNVIYYRDSIKSHENLKISINYSCINIIDESLIFEGNYIWEANNPTLTK